MMLSFGTDLTKKPIVYRFSSYPARMLGFGAAVAIGLTMWFPVPAAGQDLWTLERVIDHFLEVAPEGKVIASEVQAWRAAVQQAGSWPNPKIELRGDDRLGQEDGKGGVGITQFSVSQQIPLSGRLARETEVAEAELKAVSVSQLYEYLLLEARAARVFHNLQLASATLKLAEERLLVADTLRVTAQRRASAGELGRPATLRLDIIREDAKQVIDRAEGTFSEALSQFRTLLALPIGSVPKLAPLSPFAPLPSLQDLENDIAGHPAITSAKAGVEAARSSVELTRAERWPDPELRLFRERDFLGGSRENVTGIGVGITIPLWDMQSGRISEARARESQARTKVQIVDRDLTSRLQQSHMKLTRLVRQAEEYREKLMVPAKTFLDLTQRAYAVGEAEILGLIDANDTYFDARMRYLQLLQEAWLEAVELRLAAGRSVSVRKQGAKS